jgi:glycosyltransferase involved in cell wall biosynthesis
VLVSHPVHQHAYETAVAAQKAGALRAFVTGIYFTGRGATSPRFLGRLPSPLEAKVTRELTRRWHPELDPALVHTIPPYHGLATCVRRLAEHAAPFRRLQLDTWADLQFDKAVGRLLERFAGLQLVHAFEGSALETFRSARRLGLATVLDVASAHERYRAVLGESAPRGSLWRIRAERDLADVIFAPSDYAIECLLEHGVAAEKILKLPYGVDHLRFSPAGRSRNDEDPFRVLYVGSIGIRKGLRYLLEAWRTLGLANAELILIGQPDDAGREILREFRGHYYWHGESPKYAVDQWFKKSDVFVLPSLSDSWGLVVTEAMATGLPVVTTLTTGAPVRDGIDGFVVPPGDASALADRIKFLYEHPDARRDMGLRGRELVARAYTWTHYRARITSAYRSILAEKRCSTGVGHQFAGAGFVRTAPVESERPAVGEVWRSS